MTGSTANPRAPGFRPRPDRRGMKLIAVGLAVGVVAAVAAVAPTASAADGIQITGPADGATISTPYATKITATDAQRVKRVLARVDSSSYSEAACTRLGTTSASCTFTIPGTTSQGTHTLAAKARDFKGNVSKTSIAFKLGTAPAPGPGSGVNNIMYAAGDIACAPGNPGNDSCMDAQTNALIGDDADVIALLGDNQYEGGSLSDFNASFRKTWGNHPGDLLNPSPGNHEYRNNTASGYFDYFQNVGQSARTDSVEVGARTEGWARRDRRGLEDPQPEYRRHLRQARRGGSIVCRGEPPGQLAGGSGTERAGRPMPPGGMAPPAFHQRRESPYARNALVDPMWNSLTDPAGGGPADILLVGHLHAYERFAERGSAPGFALSSTGVREFLVGTGGKSVEGGFDNGPVPHEASSLSFGLLKLTLKDDAYDFAFKATGGATPDSGSGTCNT
ncbi:hypothetical protein BH20ACT22_BH20ACT22_22090 [soil metagenome]